MTEKFRAIDFRQISGDIDFNLRPNIGLQFREQCIVDFAAARKIAAFHVGGFHESVDSGGELPKTAFPLFELNIMAFAGGHAAHDFMCHGCSWESPCQIARFLHQLPGRARVECLDQLETRVAVERVIIHPEGFQLFQIRHYNECVLHILLV